MKRFKKVIASFDHLMSVRGKKILIAEEDNDMVFILRTAFSNSGLRGRDL